MKRRGLNGIFTTGVLATSLLAPTSALAANEMFLKLDGIVGESTAVKQEGAIDVLSWSWGESNGTARTGRGTLPKACIQDLHFVKEVDSSSPALIMKSVLGEVIPTAVLVIRTTGDNPVEYVRVTMKNVLVTSFQTGGSSGFGSLSESVSLHFESLEFQYQKQKDGRPDGSPISFDITGVSPAGCR